MLDDAASIINPADRSSALPASTGLPPRPSISRPIFGETNPDTRKPKDGPPTIQDSGQPISALIGFASTEIR